jgi:hypothetical protein
MFDAQYPSDGTSLEDKSRARVGQGAAQNARTHGLTAQLDGARVSQWYTVILGNCPRGTGERLLALDYHELALRLAQAEVRLQRSVEAVDCFYLEQGRDFSAQAQLREMASDLRFKLGNPSIFAPAKLIELELLKRLEAQIFRQDRSLKRRGRLLGRYYAEALSKRKVAFKLWCAYLGISTEIF